jgi:hypothetical protein
MLLVRIERKWAGWIRRVQPHTAQRHQIGYWGDQDLTFIVEADESTVEEVVRCLRKQ